MKVRFEDLSPNLQIMACITFGVSIGVIIVGLGYILLMILTGRIKIF